MVMAWSRTGGDQGEEGTEGKANHSRLAVKDGEQVN